MTEAVHTDFGEQPYMYRHCAVSFVGALIGLSLYYVLGYPLGYAVSAAVCVTLGVLARLRQTPLEDFVFLGNSLVYYGVILCMMTFIGADRLASMMIGCGACVSLGQWFASKAERDAKEG